ncbi:MAG TPA: hypothetical protein VFS92_10385 [Planctomycetota bacterium]|nr:hypothetical protein [Planctomycetota bacterium]
MESGPPDGTRGAAAAALLLAAALGLAVDGAPESPDDRSVLDLPVDRPEAGFRLLPGIREAGSGWPRDALRLEVQSVVRQPRGEEYDGATVTVTVRQSDGPLPEPARWCFEVPEPSSVRAPDPIRGSVGFQRLFDWDHTSESGWLVLRLWNLPPGAVRIPRLSIDLRVTPIEEPGRLRWRLRGSEDREVTFLNRYLFLELDDDGIVWGAHDRARFNPPTTRGTLVQGLLDSYRVIEGNGREVEYHVMNGRGWGRTYTRSLTHGDPKPLFPLHLEADWRRCGPTAVCRFELVDLEIPAR